MKVTDDMAGRDDGCEEAGQAGDNRGAAKGKRKGGAKRQKGNGEVDCWRRHVENIEIGGVKQEVISESELSKQKIKRWYMGDDSFMLDDGRYAYRDCNNDIKKKPLFYRVLTIGDEELKRFIHGMHAMDREEGRSYIAYCLHQDYGYENYKKRQDEDEEEWPDPIDTSDAFGDGKDASDGEKSRPFPLRSEYAVIRAVIKQMTPADREVYEMLFDSYHTEAEIKSILDLGDSAWTNRKNRFMERIKKVFVRLGYDVDMQGGYGLPDDAEDEVERAIEDLEEKKGDFGEDEDAGDDESTESAEGADSSADKKKSGKRDSKAAEDYWTNVIRNDMRQENRRSGWM